MLEEEVWLCAGSCVCNEANLSGEAMPQHKRQCPSEDIAYDVQGHGSRYSLFSSITVLQAGSTDTDQVLAVVTATGMPPGFLGNIHILAHSHAFHILAHSHAFSISLSVCVLVDCLLACSASCTT